MDEDNFYYSFYGILYKLNNKEKLYFWLNRFVIIFLKILKYVFIIYFDFIKFIVSILWKVKRIMIMIMFVVVYYVVFDNRIVNDLVYWRCVFSFVFVIKLFIKFGCCIWDVKWKFC